MIHCLTDMVHYLINKMRYFLFVSVLLIPLIMVSKAYSGRPLNTDDAGVVPPKTLEVELAYEYVDVPDQEHAISAVFTTGLTETLDLGVELPYLFIDFEDAEDEDGLSDVSLTTKWNFYNNDSLSSTLSFNYKSENGDDERSLGTGESEFTILGILSKEISDITIHFNLGPTIINEGEDVLNYNIAMEWGVLDRLVLVGELFGSNDLQDDFDANSFSGLAGLTYEVKEDFVYDLGFTFGISEADPDFKVTTGITVAFGG